MHVACCIRACFALLCCLDCSSEQEATKGRKSCFRVEQGDALIDCCAHREKTTKNGRLLVALVSRTDAFDYDSSLNTSECSTPTVVQ